MQRTENKYVPRAVQNLVSNENGWEMGRLTLFMNSSALSEIANIKDPIINCMGIIQDLRRPKEGKNRESTMGDQRSLREYG